MYIYLYMYIHGHVCIVQCTVYYGISVFTFELWALEPLAVSHSHKCDTEIQPMKSGYVHSQK